MATTTASELIERALLDLAEDSGRSSVRPAGWDPTLFGQRARRAVATVVFQRRCRLVLARMAAAAKRARTQISLSLEDPGPSRRVGWQISAAEGQRKTF